MDTTGSQLSLVKNLISNDFFIALVLLSSLYFCIRLIFPQFRLLGKTFKALSDNDGQDKNEGISPFQAFTTALGARVGVGNIAGVATAIATGGPGAVAWIWIFGIFGSALAIIEAILGQSYKIRDNDEFLGGPAYYIKAGFKNKKIGFIYSIIFAFVAFLAMCFFLPGVQSNTVVSSITNGFGLDKITTIVITAIIIGIIIWGGIKRIGKIEALLTPIKCFAFLAFAIYVIIEHAEFIGYVLNTIVSSAFGFNAALGGLMGSAVEMGIRRGLFSTDVGFGPGAIFASAARCDHPAKQGLLQGLSVLMSTLIICTCTAMIILLTDSCQIVDPNTHAVLYTGVNHPAGISAGAEWVQAGLNSCDHLHGWSPQVLAILVAIFAIGTIIGYYYMIETNLKFIFRELIFRKKYGKNFNDSTTVPITENIKIVTILKIVFLAFLILNTFLGSDTVWDFADICMGIMGWLNIIAVLILSPKAIKIFKDYNNAIKQNDKPKFVPDKYGIKDPTDAWVIN